MEDPSCALNSRLLPGSPTTVETAFERIEGLAQDARESNALTTPLIARLQFLRFEIENHDVLAMDVTRRGKLVLRFVKAISEVLRFLKKFARKNAIQRIAVSRLVREGVRRFHSTIDNIFQDAGLAGALEMTAWKELEAAAIQTQLQRLEEHVTTPGAIVNGLSVYDVEEALLEIRLELGGRNNPPEFVELFNRALNHPEILAHDSPLSTNVGTPVTEEVIAWEIEPWFVRRDNIHWAETPFDMGSFGDVYKARYGPEEVEVCVKQLLVSGRDTQLNFLREARIWFSLNHPNVIKMLGGCHVGSPLYFISELATAGNFVDFLYKSENKSKLWQLFLGAAQGLAYLHRERVVHGDIKCNNLLVGDDGKAKLCDFGFAHIKTLSIGKSLKEQPSSTPWKAPECVVGPGRSGRLARPSFQSDVYSLGMSIIEAMTGNVPWGVISEDEIIGELMEEGESGYPRPDDVFNEREWELVQGMTQYDPEMRWSLDRAIGVLEELAGELIEAPGIVLCPSCKKENAADKRFCGDCGVRLQAQ